MRNCWSLAIVFMFMMLMGMASTAPSVRKCKKERSLILSYCTSVLYGRPPSPPCCKRIRLSHVECICPVLTPKVVALVKIDSLVQLIQRCGRKFPHNFTCGSLTIP